MKIQVCDLSKFVTDEILANAFGKFGAVASATVVKDKVTGLSKRFGFVEMPDRAEALAAIKNLNHTQILKVPIRVKQAGTQKFTGTFAEPASSANTPSSPEDRPSSSAGRPQSAEGPWVVRQKEIPAKTAYEGKPVTLPYIRREKTPLNKAGDYRAGFRKQHGPERNDKARSHFSPRNDDRFSDVTRNANKYDRGAGKTERAFGQTGAQQRSKSPFGVFRRPDNNSFSETPRSDYKGRRERPFGKPSAFTMDRSFGHARPSRPHGERPRRDFPKLNDRPSYAPTGTGKASEGRGQGRRFGSAGPSHSARPYQGVRPSSAPRASEGRAFSKGKPSFEGKPSFRSRPSSHSRKKSGW